MDKVSKYISEDGNILVFAVQSGESAQEAGMIHQASPPVLAAMGRVISVAAIMASEFKGGGNVTVNIKGDGPMGGLCVVAHPGISVKAYAHDPQADAPPKSNGKLNVSGVVGNGSLMVIKDLGMKEPWSGTVDLQTGEIAEDFAYYFAVSEQTPSIVSLGVLVNREGQVLASGGLIAQPLPGYPDEVLDELEKCATEVGDLSRRLYTVGDIDQVAEHAFASMNLQKLEETPLRYQCDCTRQRVERALISVGREELEDMIQKDNGAEVKCHFCNQAYRFDSADLRQLMAQAVSGETEWK